MIGIDFDFTNTDKFSFKEKINYIDTLKNLGIQNFDFYFSSTENISNLEIYKYLKDNNIRISFHGHDINKYGTDIMDEGYCKKSLNTHKKYLKNLRNKLLSIGIGYETTVVYHPGEIEYFQIKFFKELADFAKSLKFKICIETLGSNFPVRGINLFGTQFNGFKDILKESSNIYICWDIGHTQYTCYNNNIDRLPNFDVSRIGFTHIHKFDINKGRDHFALDKNFSTEEIMFLKNNNYKGLYNLEFDFGLTTISETIRGIEIFKSKFSGS